MVWIEKDLSAIAKAILDNWETKKPDLQYQHLFASSGRVTYGDLVRLIEKGKQTKSSARTCSTKHMQCSVRKTNDVRAAGDNRNPRTR